jgi:hypothetical protein
MFHVSFYLSRNKTLCALWLCGKLELKNFKSAHKNIYNKVFIETRLIKAKFPAGKNKQ